MREEIRTLQSMLRVIAACTEGIPSVIPDGFYNRHTEESVRAFQQAAGLPVTGKVDEPTWRSITAAFEYCATHVSEPEPLRIRLEPDGVLRPGEYNVHTHLVQAMILALSKHYRNVPAVVVDGHYGSSTVRAVKMLQKLCGMEESGTVDRHFWLRLVGLYRSMAGNGIR